MHKQKSFAVFVVLLLATATLTFTCSTNTPVEELGEEAGSRSSGDDSDSTAGFNITAADTTWNTVVKPF